MNQRNIIVEAALGRQVLPLLADFAESFGFGGQLGSEFLASRLKFELQASEVFSAAAREVAQDVMRRATQIGVDCLFLKGVVTCELYSEAKHRSVSDVDVLVARNDALALFLHLQTCGYEKARYRSDIGLVPCFEEANVNGEEYELPPLWIEVQVFIDEEGRCALASRGSSRRFRLTETEIFARVPVEIHYSLVPGLSSEDLFRTAVMSLGGLPKLEHTVELLYTLYKMYVDVVIGRRDKGFKLACDLFRMANSSGALIDFDRLRHEAERVGIPQAVEHFLCHSACIYSIEGLPVPRDVFPGMLDFGDFLISLLPARWRTTVFHFDVD